MTLSINKLEYMLSGCTTLHRAIVKGFGVKRLPTREQLEADLASSSPDWWASLPQGKKCTYTCENCRREIVTIDADRGVTPMLVTCSDCGFQMFSNFYRTPAEHPHTHVWYRPEGKELKRLLNNPTTKDHFLNGGLSIKEVSQ